MDRKRNRQRIILLLVILLALMALLTAFAAVLHDDDSCDHDHCALCDFLHHRNDAIHSMAAVAVTLLGISIFLLSLGTHKKTVIFTPVYLKVRMDR